MVWTSLGSFSLQEHTCMHCVYLALWTYKVLRGSFLCTIYKCSHSFLLHLMLRMVEKFHLTLRMSSVPCRLVQIRLTMWCCKTGLVTQDRSCIPGYLSPPWLMSSRISFTSYDVCLLKGLLKQRHVKDNFQVTWLAYFCFFSQSTANGG